MDLGQLLECDLCSTFLSPREKCLISLLLEKASMGKNISALTNNLDLDIENQNYLLMLARLGFTRGWDKFPEKIVPRLKGIHHYHQVHNTIGFSGLVRQLRILAAAGIPIMLIKGIAVRAYYAPNAPRIMWDYDIAVPEARFEEAVELLCGGNWPTERSPHSVAIKTEDVDLDLHQWIFKTNGERQSDIWERAIQTTFCGMRVYVLAPEDMLIHLLDTQSRSIFNAEETERQMQWLCDCWSVMRLMGELNLPRIAARAKELHAKNHVRIALKLIATFFPALFTEAAIDEAFPSTEGYYQMLLNAERYREEKRKYKIQYPRRLAESVTPMHVICSLRLAVIRYQYWASELKDEGRTPHLLYFMKKMYYIDGFSALKRKYCVRICSHGNALKTG